MMNIQHYKDEIEAINDKGEIFGVSKTGKPVSCKDLNCRDCLFSTNKNTYCEVNRLDWLIAEYKEKPTITKQEYHFLKAVQTGWISKDGDEWLTWFEEQPIFDDCDEWTPAHTGAGYFSFSNVKGLSFDVVKNKQLWKVEDLLNLGVEADA